VLPMEPVVLARDVVLAHGEVFCQIGDSGGKPMRPEFSHRFTDAVDKRPLLQSPEGERTLRLPRATGAG